jgi:hypothetical protein
MRKSYLYIRTSIYTFIHIFLYCVSLKSTSGQAVYYVYMSVRLCVCVCLCVRESERGSCVIYSIVGVNCVLQMESVLMFIYSHAMCICDGDTLKSCVYGSLTTLCFYRKIASSFIPLA